MEYSADTDHLKAVYRAAAFKYKPREISTLLISEGPPCALERYFYFEDVKTHDSLFLEIMGIIYPALKKRYLASRRESILKEELLESFQLDGYFLLDLSEVPTSMHEIPLAACLPALFTRLEKYISPAARIICIKANVYDICYAPMVAKGYNVVNARIPFPGSGQQKVFREKFSSAIGLE